MVRLPGGEKQRLSIAGQYSKKSNYIIDEATSSLDAEEKTKFKKLSVF